MYIGEVGSQQGAAAQWTDNKSDGETYLSSHTRQGLHTTTYSPLVETHQWLHEQHELHSAIVDCEVGHMAQACNEFSMEFAYLHIISDNVATRYAQSLANERTELVAKERHRLFGDVVGVLQAFVEQVEGIEHAKS